MSGQLNSLQFTLVSLVCIGSIGLVENVQAQTNTSKSKTNPSTKLIQANNNKSDLSKLAQAANAKSQDKQAAPPAKIVLDYYNTLASAKNPTQLLQFYSAKLRSEQEQTIKQVTPARISKFMQYLRLGLLKKIRTINETIDGDNALVYVEATTNDPMDTLQAQQCGTVKPIMQKYGAYFLVKENGQWKVDSEKWDSKPLAANLTNPNKWDAWANEAVKIEAPQNPAQGKLEGSTFVPASCTIGPDQFFGGTWLTFKSQAKGNSNPDSISIGLLDDKTNVAEKSFEISNDKMSWNKTKMFNIIFESDKYPGQTKTQAGAGICGMKLKFGKATAEGIPGTIILRMKYQPETSLQGTFIAKQK
jgi:hypothetical protein